MTVQAVVSRQLRQVLRPSMRSICDDAGGRLPGRISIARLEIDLGRFPADSFDQEFGDRFLQAFGDALEAAVAGRTPTHDFDRFLRTGVMPDPSVWGGDGDPGSWLRARMQEEPDAWRDFLAEAGRDAVVLQRLASIADDSVIQEIRARNAAMREISQGPASDRNPVPATDEESRARRGPRPDMAPHTPEAPGPGSAAAPESSRPRRNPLPGDDPDTPPVLTPADEAAAQNVPARRSLLRDTAPDTPPPPTPADEAVTQKVSARRSGVRPIGVGAASPSTPAEDAATRAIRARADRSRNIGLRTMASPVPPNLVEPIRIFNAGLVLLWPLLPGLLMRAGFVRDRAFVDETARLNAVWLLDDMIWNDDLEPEPERTLFTRLLCGLADAPKLEQQSVRGDGAWRAPTQVGRDFARRCLDEALPRLLRSDKVTVKDFRALFLQRPGALAPVDDGWVVTVDPHAGDVLLGAAPWPLTQVHLPWLAAPILVEWLPEENLGAGR